MPGGRFELEEIAVERPGEFVMFMRSPLFAGHLPGGAEWMKIDLSEELGSRAQSPDPRAHLKLLRSTHGLEKIGTERIRGVRTTHYRATVDQEAEVRRLRAHGENRAADALQRAIRANGGNSDVDLDVWVGRGAIHRYSMEMPMEIGTGSGAEMHMTIDLYDFGIEPEIELPDEDAVFDASDAAREGLEQLSRQAG